jgi:hypothetical protein
MALKKNTVSLPFALGLDEKSSEDTAEPGSLESCSNAKFNKGGQIEKRSGYVSKTPSSLTPNHTFDRGLRIDQFDNQTLVATGSNLYSITENEIGGTYASRQGVLGTKLDNITFLKSDEVADQQPFFDISNVKHISHQIGTGKYVDVYVYLESSLTNSSAVLKVKDRDTGSLLQTGYLGGGVMFLHSTGDHNNGTPSIHLVKISSSSSLFFVYNQPGPFSSSLYYQKLTYSSTSNAFTITSPQSLLSTTSAQLESDLDFSALGVTASNSQLYVALYQPNYGSGVFNPTIDNARLHRFSLASLTGTGPATALSDFTLFSTTAGAGLPRAIANNTLRVSPGFVCKYYPDDPSDEPLVVGLTTPPGGGKSVNCTIFTLDSDFSNFSTANYVGSSPGLNTERVIINGTQAPYTTTSGAQNDKRKLIMTVARPSPGITRGFPYARQDLPSAATKYSPLLSVTATHSSGTGPGSDKEGFLSIDPVDNSTFFKSSAKVYYKYTNSGHTLEVQVLEGGTMFGGSGEAANIEAQLVAAITGTISFTITFTVADDLQPGFSDPEFVNAAYDHAVETADLILTGSHGGALTATQTQYMQNATVITDAILANTEGTYSDTYNYNGAMPKSMFYAISVQNGTGKSDNSYDCLMSWSPDTAYSGNTRFEPSGYLPTGNQSVNVALDFNNKNGSGGGRLLTGVTELNFVSITTAKVGGELRAQFQNLEYATASVFGDTYNVAKSVVELKPRRELPAKDIGTQMLYGGGALFSYDGEEIFENGFYNYPAVRNAVVRTLGVAGNNFPSGYNGETSYVFVYEYEDAKGNIHRSPTSPAITVNVTVGSTVEFLIYNDQVNRKFTKYNLCMYRANTGGTIFKKVQTLATTSFSYYIVTDSGEAQAAYDSLPALYTTGGVLENQQPGSVTDIVVHKGRVIVAAASEYVRYSKPLSPFEAPGFPAPHFVLDIPGDKRDISGIETNANFLAVFTTKSVYAIYGDGPNAIGAGGFALPLLIGDGQGLPAGSRHLTHTFGIFYMAERGLYVLTPQAQIQYVGAPAEDLLSRSYSEAVLNMSLCDYQNEIRILLVSDDKTRPSGQMAVYNTFFRQWSHWEVRLDNLPAHQALFNGKYLLPEDSHHLLTIGGTIAIQDASRSTDLSGGAIYDIDLSVVLNKIYAAGLQQAQRVYRAMLLYELVGSPTVSLQMSFAFDNDSSFTESHTINPLPSDPESVRVHLTQQKCKAVKVKLLLQSSTTGAKLNGIAFEVGARAGTFKLPSANTF